MAGSTFTSENDVFDTPAACVDEYRSIFWQAEFTQDYSTNFRNIQAKDPEHFSTLKKWQQWSKRDPGYALEVPYLSQDIHGRVGPPERERAFGGKRTVGDLLKDITLVMCGNLQELRTTWGVVRKFNSDEIVAEVLKKCTALIERPSKHHVDLAHRLLKSYLARCTRDLRKMHEHEVIALLDKLNQDIESAFRKSLGLPEPQPEKPETGFESKQRALSEQLDRHAIARSQAKPETETTG